MEQAQILQINELAQVTLHVCGIVIRKNVLPDCRGPVSVITGKNLNIREITSSNVLFINSLSITATILKFNFKIVTKVIIIY